MSWKCARQDEWFILYIWLHNRYVFSGLLQHFLGSFSRKSWYWNFTRHQECSRHSGSTRYSTLRQPFHQRSLDSTNSQLFWYDAVPYHIFFSLERSELHLLMSCLRSCKWACSLDSVRMHCTLGCVRHFETCKSDSSDICFILNLVLIL